MSNEVYLDRDICETIGIDYHKPVEEEINLHVGTLLGLRKEWDRPHRQLFASFLLRDRRLQLIPVGRPGWWKAINVAKEEPWAHFGQSREEALDTLVSYFRKYRKDMKPVLPSDGSSGQYDCYTEVLIQAVYKYDL